MHLQRVRGQPEDESYSMPAGWQLWSWIGQVFLCELCFSSYAVAAKKLVFDDEMISLVDKRLPC